MRIWVAVIVMLLGCKKNAERTPGSGTQPVAAVADATFWADATPPVDAPPSVDAAPRVDTAAGPAPIDKDKVLELETIGPVKLGMVDADVQKALGAPSKKSSVVEESATGSFVSKWSWPGITLHMEADTKQGPFKVAAITATKPPHATARGIKVGSTRADLELAYPRSKGEGYDDANNFLVGTAHGGLLLTLKQGVVTEMFLGTKAF